LQVPGYEHGNFVRPTILANLAQEMQYEKQKIFDPALLPSVNAAQQSSGRYSFSKQQQVRKWDSNIHYISGSCKHIST
jgi:hypothetical protein